MPDQNAVFDPTNGENYELYDLIEDKAEKNNIIDQKSEIAERMKNELLLWTQSVKNSQEGLDYDSK